VKYINPTLARCSNNTAIPGDTCHEAAAAAIYWTTFPLPVIKTQ